MNLAPAVELIAKFEGLARVGPDGLVRPYRDLIGVWTVGYGSTAPEIVRGAPYTPEQCRVFLVREIIALRAGVIARSPVLALPGNENRLAAIISFAYNLGLGAYRGSTLARRVDAQDWPGAAVQLGRWVFAGGQRVPGLVRRRAEEAALVAT